MNPRTPCLILSLWLGPASLFAQAPPKDLDAYVTRAMRQFEVPGLALAIVKDGQVLVSRGYGVRRLGDPAPVDAQTLFGIASNTKAFTATALGMLVEEGTLAWDSSVVKYLPAFQLYDPFVTRELTVRDLLVRRLRYIKPVTSFRAAYAYDNVLYSVAGELIEAVSGQSWEDFVATRILARVGMTGSSVRHSAAAADGNVATPHAPVDGPSPQA